MRASRRQTGDLIFLLFCQDWKGLHQISFVNNDAVSIGDLLECFVHSALGSALIVIQMPLNIFGINHGDDPIQAEVLANVSGSEYGNDRARVCEAGRFNNNVVEFAPLCCDLQHTAALGTLHNLKWELVL